jgi:hypothetical protein
VPLAIRAGPAMAQGDRGNSTRARGTRYAFRSLVQGTITGKDVLIHSFTILRLWGPGVYLRCIRAICSGRRCTFLGVLSGNG